MQELTLEKSTEQSHIILLLGLHISQLDLPYLKEALSQMKDNHSTRDAGMILSPNPHTFIEKQKVDALKIKQLDLMLQLRENMDAINDAKDDLRQAGESAKKLEEIFG